MIYLYNYNKNLRYNIYYTVAVFKIAVKLSKNSINKQGNSPLRERL